MLTESFIVAASGAIVGVLMAFWAVDMLVRADSRLVAVPPPYWVEFTIDAPALVFTLADRPRRDIVSGLVPPSLARAANAAEMMKEGGRGNSSRLVNIITRDSGGRTDCADCRACSSPRRFKLNRSAIRSNSNYGYDENGVYCRAHGINGRRLSNAAGARREFFKRALRSLRSNPGFESAAMSDRFRHDLRWLRQV